MKYFEYPRFYTVSYGLVYAMDSPIFNECTLYRIKKKGLGVIQQYYDPETKHTWWGPIDEALVDALYLSPNFLEVFESIAKESVDRTYPVLQVRRLMHLLGLPPLRKEPWETRF